MSQILASVEKAHQCILAARVADDYKDLRPYLDAVLIEIYRCYDRKYDSLVGIQSARSLLSQAQGEDAILLGKLQLETYLDDAERSFRLESFSDPQPAAALLAASSLHVRDFERELVEPYSTLELPASPLLELRELPEPDPAFVVDPLPAFSTPGWARTRLEDHFHDICALGLSRIPQMAEPWRSVRFVEKRLFASIDAALSIQAVNLSWLEGVFLQSPAPDPQLLFGLSVLGGVLFGRDGLAMSERCLTLVADEPEFLPIYEDAWSLLGNPMVDDILRIQLEDSSLKVRASALRILARRGTVRLDELERAICDGPETAAAALVPYLLQGGVHARHYLDELDRSESAQQSTEFRRQFRIAAILSGYPRSSHREAEHCRQGDQLASVLIGVSAEKKDAQQLLEWTGADPNESLITALGWAGDPACLGLLIGLLVSEDMDLVIAAAAALERITGAGLVDPYMVDAEGVMENTVNTHADSGALRDETTNSRDPEPEASPETIILPSRDQERWRAFVLEHQEKLVPGIKTRKGYPYTPLVSLYELDKGAYSPSERRALWWEIIVRAGMYVPFDVAAFVDRQEQQLVTIGDLLQKKAWQPGAWSLPLERSVSPPASLPATT